MAKGITAKQRSLFVFQHLDDGWAPCARLTMTEEGHRTLGSELGYGQNYLKRPNAREIDPLTLSLKRNPGEDTSRLIPPNGLPLFGAIRDAAPDAWGRRVIEARLKVPANSLPESDYLLHAGSERVGSLDVRSRLTDDPVQSAAEVHVLPYLLEAADRIEAGLPVPEGLEFIFQAGSALGGARPKASVRDEQGVLWLAKFGMPKDAFDIPGVERASLELARQAGLHVPSVKLLSVGGREVMFIRRFDRYWASGSTAQQAPAHDDWPAFLERMPAPGRAEQRLSFISGLTLLACHETESMNRFYVELADAIRAHCHPTIIRQDCEELFKRMVFNIFVSNDDDHLRNHGFLYDPRLQGWRLSPLYDVLPRPGHSSERFLHLGVGLHGRHADLDNAMSLHVRFTPTKRRALQLLDEVWRAVRQWKVCFEAQGLSAITVDKVGSAFRHIDDISSAGLRRDLVAQTVKTPSG